MRPNIISKFISRVLWDEPFKSKFHKTKMIYTTPSPTAGILSMTYVKLIERLMTEDQNILRKFSRKILRSFEIFKIVLAHWRFLGDSKFAHDSKEMYEYMQGNRFILKLKKLLYTYRHSETEFDRDLNNTDENRYMNLTKASSNCKDGLVSFINYLNKYRMSLCDFIDYPLHDSMDIMVYTHNRDAVIISTSLTST